MLINQKYLYSSVNHGQIGEFRSCMSGNCALWFSESLRFNFDEKPFEKFFNYILYLCRIVETHGLQKCDHLFLLLRDD